VVVEIGSAYGYSTVAMALVAKRVISVDPHTGLDDSEQVLRGNLHAFGVADRVDVVVETSQAFCARKPPTAVDLVFIDGDHSVAATLHDLQCAAKMLRPGGTLAVHDYARLETVRQAVDVATGGKRPRIVDSLGIVRDFHIATSAARKRQARGCDHGFLSRAWGCACGDELG
jgi:predicted O-methyltransferase YrrM